MNKRLFILSLVITMPLIGLPNNEDHSIKNNKRVKSDEYILATIFWAAATVIGHGANIFMAKEVAKAVGASKDKTKKNPDPVTPKNDAPLFTEKAGYEIGTNFVYANVIPGGNPISGLPSVGAKMYEYAPIEVQNATKDVVLTTGVISAGNNIGWVEAFADRAWQVGMKVPEKPIINAVKSLFGK